MRRILSTLLFLSICFSFIYALEGVGYSYLPKKLHPNQVFPVTILDATGNETVPEFRFERGYFTMPLDDKPLVIRNGKERFFTFYFKASGASVFLPAIEVVFPDSTEHYRLLRHEIPVIPLPTPPKNFCGVLATQMKVRNFQVSHYDETHYLTTISLEAYEANLEDIRLPGYEEQGVEEFMRKNAKATIDLYVVVPAKKQRLTLSYYNTLNKHYETLEVPVELVDVRVAGQSELNPKNTDFDTLKKYFFLALGILFAVLALLYRDLFYLALAAVAFVTLLTFYTPHKKICVKQGAPLYILPTYNADISTRISERIETTLLGTRQNFNKIEYKKGIVGWVKNEDLCKN